MSGALRQAFPGAVHDAVDQLMTTARVPGLSLAVVRRGEPTITAGFGMADLARAVPATSSTAYLWFSMTKLVTATAAVRLAAEGRLDLDAPVRDHLAWFRSDRGPGPDLPTVRQLLQHTSGLRNPLPLRWVRPAGSPPSDPELLLRRLMARRGMYRGRPGEVGRYSNVGYLVLGEVLRVASGMPFAAWVHQAVLDPVGMSVTGFTAAEGSRAAVGYVRSRRVLDPVLRGFLPSGVVGRRHGPYLALEPFVVDGPAYGGLIGDVADAARFLRMHLQDGELDGCRVLTAADAVAMRRPAGPGMSHGLGWWVLDRGAVEHIGGGAGFRSVMRLYPDQGFGVVVMTNSTAGVDIEPLARALGGAP